MSNKSLTARAFSILLNRPTQLWAYFRGYFLFCLTAALRPILLRAPSINFESGVRLQRLSSIVCEAPLARIIIGQDTIIYEDSKLESYGNGCIKIGRGSIIGGAKIVSRQSVEIGKRFLSSWNVFIQDFDPHPTDSKERAIQVETMVSEFRPRLGAKRAEKLEMPNRINSASITIGDDVWLGAQVTILKGVTIGHGSVVAAGAVVVKGVYPERALIAGNPAKVIKIFD